MTAGPPSGDTSGSTPARSAAPGRARRGGRGADRIRFAARGIGQLLVTAGLVMLLFVVYEVYVTDIFGHEKQETATQQLDQLWDTTAAAPPSAAPPSAATSAPTAARTTSSRATTPAVTSRTAVVVVTDPNRLVTDPGARTRNYQTTDGQGFAKIFVPSFGADYVFTIIEGTSTDDLYSGPGHYADTQYPGEQGNFSVAGHRVSKGSPFNQLGLLSSCDAVVIETKSDWFVYRVLPMQSEVAGWSSKQHAHCAGVSPQKGQYAKTFGREITSPSDYAQVLPVPHVASRTVPTGAERLVTLTTCHPQFSDAQRMIIHGVLVKSYKKSAGFLPPELNES